MLKTRLQNGGLDRYLECMSQKGSSHDKKTWNDGIITEASEVVVEQVEVYSRMTP